jgi:hypothetical protein
MAVEKINSDISNSAVYQEWLKNFRSQDSEEKIKQLLKNLTRKAPGKARNWLKLHVLVTCFCADKYKKEDDRGHQYRKQEKNRTKEIGRQINAIKKVIKFVERDPYSSINFFYACQALNIPKQNGFKIPKNRRPGPITFKVPKDRIDKLFPEVLENYVVRLKGDLKYSKARFKKMLFTYGGLAFPETKPAQSGKVFIMTEDGQTFKIRDIRRNSFFFHMTYIFRHFTADKLNLGDDLRRMPDIGESHYDLTEQIYAELFPNEMDAIRAAERIINHLVSSRVFIHPWHLSI